MWAVESMLAHGLQRIIFEIEEATLVGATTRPEAWPSFGFESNLVMNSIQRFVEWNLEFVLRCANRGASFIAQSVTREHRSQSYVAVGSPFWLLDMFDSERRLSYV